MFAAEFTLCNIKLGGKSNSEVLTSVHLDLRRVRLGHSGKVALWFPCIAVRKSGGKCLLQTVKSTKAILTVESKVKNFSEYVFTDR